MYLVSSTSFAQQDIDEVETDIDGSVIFARIKTSSKLWTMSGVDEAFRQILKTKADDDMRLFREHTDELGVVHRYYEQYYRGIRVKGGIYIVHGKGNSISIMNGNFISLNGIVTSPQISEKAAFESALKSIGAKKYRWELPAEENELKQRTNNSTATYLPKASLIICRQNINGNQYRLAYEFDIAAVEPHFAATIYIDAHTADVIREESHLLDVNATGSGTTRYSGSQTITTDTYAGAYRLSEIRQGVTISTKNLQKGELLSNAIEFTDNNNSWIEYNNVNKDDASLDVHWASEKVFDYFKNVHNRNSLDGNGMAILNYVHWVPYPFSNCYANAAWDRVNNVMLYGDGCSPYLPFVSVDIVAHELGHGLCQKSIGNNEGLTYENESGALNEGLSDIWGAVVESFSTTNKQTWLAGEEVVPSGTVAFRSMSNPSSLTYTLSDGTTGSYPDTYLGNGYYNVAFPTGADKGGVHVNSSILNFWFYLISMGGTGTNDNGKNYCVSGIGITKGAAIVYRTETIYLTPNTNFAGMKAATLQATRDLYGVGSVEEFQVASAWYAVGLSNTEGTLSVTGGSLVCTTGVAFSLQNVPSGSVVNWSYPSYLQALSGQGTTSISLKSNIITPGAQSYATAKLAGQCTSMTKTFWVGVPNQSNLLVRNYNTQQQNPQLCLNRANYLQAFSNFVTQEGIDQYGWQWVSGGTFNNPSPYDVAVITPNTANVYYKLRAHNTCGWSSYLNYSSYATSCGSLLLSYSIHPNPASEIIVIEFEEESNAASGQTNDVNIEMLDNSNMLVKATTFSYSEKMEIDVSDLLPGIYVLVISHNGLMDSERLVIK
jgi:Zn-dependent metalloprotease